MPTRRSQFLVLLALASIVLSAEAAERIEPDVANQNLIKRVEPVVPPLAKTLGIGGSVIGDITISEEGKVSSLKVLTGSPFLVQAYMDALKQWQYTPFVRDGHAVSVVTKVVWTVPSPNYSKSEERALKDYYPEFKKCYALVREGQEARAETECAETVKLSDELPASRILERSDSRTFLAHALMHEHRPADAIPLYEAAVKIGREAEHSEQDGDFATKNANLARAYFATGHLEAADLVYERSISIFRAAVTALPSMRENYTARLKDTLLEYAKLKSVRGDVAGAKVLEQEAAELPAR